METFHSIVGHHSDAAIHDELHRRQRDGTLVTLSVRTADLGRRRFKAVGSDGNTYGVALSRDDVLRDGSVLVLDDVRAVVIEGDEGETLALRAATLTGGIQLGWHAGHLHWRVRMEGDTMTVLLDGPADEYLVRIAPWLETGDIEAPA